MAHSPLALALFALFHAIPASAGGAFNGAGGGDLFTAEPLTFESFRRESRAIVHALPYVFHRTELATPPFADDPPPVRELMRESPALYKKLFAPGPHNVYSNLAKLELELPEHGACKDPKGVDKDGSAHGNTICLSFARLQQGAPRTGLNKAAAWRLLSGLAAHEVSHLSGATEAEAQLLQKWIENQVSSKTYQNFASELAQQLRQLEAIDIYLARSLTQLDKPPTATEANTMLTGLFPFFGSWVNDQAKDNNLGIAFFSVTEQYRIFTMREQFEFLLYYLPEEPGYPIDHGARVAFQGQKSMSVPEYYGVVNTQCQPRCDALDPQDTYFDVEPGDFAAFKAQLEAMKKITGDLLASLKAIP
jgi:hypothetical protein